MITINRNPSARDLKWFGLLLLAFFAILGALARWRFDAPSGATVGVALSAVYYAAPPIRPWIFVGWMYAAFPIGWTISHLLMLIIYYLILTPLGLMVRLSGRDLLDRRFDPDATSYWSRRPSDRDPSSYFRQF